MAKTKYDHLTREDLLSILIKRDSERKLGLVWERDQIEHERALNDDFVALDLLPDLSVGKAPYQNLLIEGDNFDALRNLSIAYRGKVRCICIDPPYNRGKNDFIYNDNFIDINDAYRHSKWLEFMYRRLLLARDLLSSDGAVLVCINDENRAKLELLMDNVFPGMRLGSFVWRTKDTSNDAGRNFSQVHEHILVYANKQFYFNGGVLDLGKYRYQEPDGRKYTLNPLTKAHDYIERENTYYPVQDPQTGYWYPCDPDRVWAYATEKRLKPGQKLRADTMEGLIRNNLIYFPSCKPSQVKQWNTLDELLAAIRDGEGPILPKKKTPLLREDLPDLEFWVGKPIAPGRPSVKGYLDEKDSLIAPVCSWIAGQKEKVEPLYDEFEMEIELETIRSARGGEGTDVINEILGSKAFNHPKPPSLMRALIRQATTGDDIVLDFFAGSGTTAHAVLLENQQDGGNRRFIMVSSTEATSKDPDKNICRDVCAKRIKGVIEGYRKTPGTGGNFAYLKTRRIPFTQIHLDVQHDQVWYALQLLHTQEITPFDENQAYQVLDFTKGAVCYVPSLNSDTQRAVLELANTTRKSTVMYTWQPGVLAQQIYSEFISIEKIPEYLMERFGGNR